MAKSKSAPTETTKMNGHKIQNGRVAKHAEPSKATSKSLTAKAKSQLLDKASKHAKHSKGASSASSNDSASDSDSASESKDDADDDSEDDKSSDSGEGSSSNSDSDSERDDKPAPAKRVDGTKVANGAHADSDDSSEGSDSEASEKAAPKKKAKANGHKAPASSDDDDQSSSDDDAKADDASSGSSSEASSDSDDDDDDNASDEEQEASNAKQASVPDKKRKADAVDHPTAKKSKTDNTEGTKNLFVGNLSWNVDEEWLRREFSEFGAIAGCRIITDRATGRSKGFGYVEYENADDAANALEAQKGAMLDGREMNVDFSTPRVNNDNAGNRFDRNNDRAAKFGDTKSNPSDTLFVGNIAFSATAEELQEMFGEYGNITRVSLPTDPASGAPKGFGYISYTSVDEAQAALDALSGANVSGRPVRLDFATPRSNDNGGGRGGRGDFRGGRGGGDRGGRGGGRGGPRGGRGDSRGGGRGRGFSTNRGGIGDFSGRKVTF